jgi:outer membrane protein assembly factor BamB
VSRLAACLALALALAGCASGSKIEREPPTPLADFRPGADIEELWEKRLGWGGAGHDLRLEPALDGDRLYAAHPDGWVSAFDARSGRRLWEVDLGARLSGAAAVAEQVLLVASVDGRLLALARASGERLWEAPLSSEALAPAAAQGGVAVVQTVDGKLAAFTVADGRRQWLYERSEPALSLRGTARPLIVGPQVVAGFASGKLAVVAMRDGRLLSEIVVAQPRGRNEIERLVDVDAAPLVVDDALYALSFQGKLVAVDLRTGRAAWSRDVSSFTGMDADRKNLYLTDEQGHLLALDLRSGASVWRQERLRGRRPSAPLVAGEYVVVGDYEGYVHWLARDDGRFVARARVGGHPIRVRPQADADAVYVANEDGVLAALRAVAR